MNKRISVLPDIITPDFFCSASSQDFIVDMYLCKSLKINPFFLQRKEIKANILSKLTGKPFDQMIAFYSQEGERDMTKDTLILQELNLQPSQQKDSTKARAENKSRIANKWITQNDKIKDASQYAINANQIEKIQSNIHHENPAVSALLEILGLESTGSLDEDLEEIFSIFHINARI